MRDQYTPIPAKLLAPACKLLINTVLRIAQSVIMMSIGHIKGLLYVLSRTIIYKTLDFDNPARIGRQMWLLPWAQQNCAEMVARLRRDFPDDIIHSPGYAEPLKTTGNAYEVGTFVDEWGCVYKNVQRGIIGEVKDPPVKQWSDVEKLREPIEALTVDKDKVNEFCRYSDKFILANTCPRPFERLQFLRGTENVMMDLALAQPELFELLDKLHRFFLKEVELWSRTAVDGIMFMDDWGTQQSLLISPEMWRKHFKPLYKDYIDIAHSKGKKVFMHSDGYILDIIPELIELGLDALNSQVFCMGLDNLEQFKGKITFWGEIDRQHLLPEGSPADIKDAVNMIQQHLYQNGGVIAQLEFGPGAKPDNVYAAFEAWQEFTG